jgi:nucleotidyltransferase substrate binding protein (TIGR01987 family)
MKNLNISALEKAIFQFEKGITEAQKNQYNELMRDGVIQRFEYTLDLAWKILQRYLKHNLQIEDASIRSKKDIFREAARAALIEDAETWLAHYEARNETSHDYNQKKAEDVYAQALKFLPDVIKLFETLKNVT